MGTLLSVGLQNEKRREEKRRDNGSDSMG